MIIQNMTNPADILGYDPDAIMPRFFRLKCGKCGAVIQRHGIKTIQKTVRKTGWQFDGTTWLCTKCGGK